MLYWSPYRWHSPQDGFTAQPFDWRYVDDATANALARRYGLDALPDHPGEYVILDDLAPLLPVTA